MIGKKTCLLAASSALLLTASAEAALVAHYALDEVAGVTAVDSAGSNDGSIVGAPDLTVAGILGTGIGTASAADRVEIADNATAGLYSGNDARSISLWFSANSVLEQGRLIGSGSGAAAQFDITLEGDGIGLRYGNGNMFWSGGVIDLDDGGLHHVTVTYDGTTLGAGLTVYIDGVDQGGPDGGNSNNSGQALATANGFWIASDTSNSRGHDGVIDEVRVYDNVLTQQEVTALANVPEPGSLALLGMGGLMLVRHRRA